MYASAAQLIREHELDFYTRPVQVVPGLNFDQLATIRQIHMYENSSFLNGNSDEYGDKVFWDISTPIVRNAAKSLVLNTKDIQVRARNGKDYFKSWLYRRAVRNWMHEHHIDRKLNRIPEMVCGMGTVVVRKIETPDVFEFVDLRNMACDPTARTLTGGWVDIKHYFTPNDLREKKALGWDSDAIEAAISDFITNRSENYIGAPNTVKPLRNAQFICVHEYEGYAPEYLLEGEIGAEAEQTDDNTKLVLGHFVSILPEDKQGSGGTTAGPGNNEIPNTGLDFYKAPLKKLSYKELHYRKVPGRWMGRGLREDLFVAQQVKNTQINWQLLAMRLSQTIIFQTRNKTPMTNILSQTKNGAILKFGEGSGDPLLRLQTQNTGMADASDLSSQIQELLSTIGNSFGFVNGSGLPSHMSFQIYQAIQKNAEQLFDFIRQDYGIFLQEVFEEWVLPEVEKELLKEGVLEILDPDELQYVRAQYAKSEVWKATMKFLSAGKMPTVEQVQQIQDFVMAQLKDKNSMFINWEAGFLEIDKKIEVDITDEREDPSMMQTLTTIIQAVTQNPAILQMPAFQRILDTVGLNVSDIIPAGPPPGAPQPQPNQPPNGAPPNGGAQPPPQATPQQAPPNVPAQQPAMMH